jgi:hypothetical protein
MILPAHLAGVAERDIALPVLQMLVEAHAMPADERQMNRQCSRPPGSSAPFLAERPAPRCIDQKDRASGVGRTEARDERQFG